MSIEAMKQAIEALNEAVAFREGGRQKAIDAINALRTAIQQAESEPVAVRNPFAARCYTMSESHLSGHRLIVGFEKLEDAQAAHEWVARCGRGDSTHPAPGVPDDAKRLNWLDDTNKRFRMGWEVGQAPAGNVSIRTIITGGKSIRDAIDAAMLAAKEGGAA